MKASKHLAGIARLTADLTRAADADELVAALLDGLRAHLALEHTALMLVDERAERLFTVATRGFKPSGVGSEQRIGEGLWGKVAERRAQLRIAAMGRELAYARTVRDVAARAGDERLTRVIALPGLPSVESVLATPIVAGTELVGVLGVQSAARLAFDADDENALAIIALVAATRLTSLRGESAAESLGHTASAVATAEATHVRIVRYYHADDSVFVDHDYVIKGLAGRILRHLLCEHARGRSTFTNKELRVTSDLKLSEIRENLESRLILLRTRLDEKACGIRLVKHGRGQFGLEVSSPLELVDVEDE